MAQMFPRPLPQYVRDDPKRGAEVRVYEMLERTLSDAFFVFYGVPWLMKDPRRGPRDGEADFIVAHAEHGILVLEVKGGRIARDGATASWSSTDRSGVTHPIKDPFQQAAQIKHDLIAKIRECRDWHRGFIAVGHGVVFPDSHIESGWLTPNAPSRIALSRGDMDSLGAGCLDIYRAWRMESTGLSPLGAEGLDLVTRLLAPTFELRVPLGVAISEEERQIIRLTEEQFRLLDALGRNRRVAVEGGAGTGKTMLALEKAKRLAREGLRVLLTCFNKPLSEYLKRSVSGVKGLDVYTFHGFCTYAAALAGVPFRARGDNPPPDYYERELPDALAAALDTGKVPTFDAILVDEGQDFSPSWWPWLEMCLTDTHSGIFYIFHDDNQRLYRSMVELPNGMFTACLTQNLRNTRGIHAFVRTLYSGGTFEAGGPPGRDVELVALRPDRSWHEEVAALLTRLVVQERVAPQRIAVLTPTRTEVLRLVPQRNAMLGRIEVTTDAQACPTHVLIETIKKFKGLERPVVVLAGLEGLNDMDDAEATAQLYVGASRAREHLVVVAASDTIRRLQAIAGAAKGKGA